MQISEDELISYLSEIEMNALFLLSGADDAPIPGDTAYQKEFFFIVNSDEELRDDADFEPYYFGPYSEPAEEAMKHLISYGLAKKKDGKYHITEYGKKIVEILKNKPLKTDIELIDEIKVFLNDLTQDERILFTYVLNPDYTTESKIREDVLAKRLPLANNMYKKGKIDLEMAAHLSGLSMENFLDKIRKKGSRS